MEPRASGLCQLHFGVAGTLLNNSMKLRDILESISMPAIHRTTPAAARAIQQHGFKLSTYGAGAGAGPGEPAGVFVSIGDGADFSKENDKRQLGMTTVIHLDLHVTNCLDWSSDDRNARFKKIRLEFLQWKFNLSKEEATAIIRYSMRLKEIPKLDMIADWLDSRDGEAALALYFNQSLRAEGYDAVRYRDPWQGMEQMIVLDPSKITIKP